MPPGADHLRNTCSSAELHSVSQAERNSELHEENSMNFSEFICFDAVNADLQSTDKEEVIAELIGTLVASGDLQSDQSTAVISAVMDRERLGTTGIGRGIAVPHATLEEVDRPTGTVGISRSGVDFNSLDGSTTNAFFLLVSPASQRPIHLQMLERISRHLKDENFCKFLIQSKDAAAIRILLNEADGEA